jgi:hypothetical protein
MSTSTFPTVDLTQLLLKEYDNYMLRVGFCQDIVKSIVLQTLTTVLAVAVGDWAWFRSVAHPTLLYVTASIVVTGLLLAFVVGYAVFSIYMTWLDRRMCEIKLNYLRRSFFEARIQHFDVARYRQLKHVRRRGSWKDFAHMRSKSGLGNPLFLNSVSLILLAALCWLVMSGVVLARWSEGASEQVPAAARAEPAEVQPALPGN